MRTIRRLLVVFTLLTLALSVNAQSEYETQTVNTQTSKKSFWRNFTGGAEFGMGFPHHGVDHLCLDFYLGYKFVPRAYVFIIDQEMFGLREEHGYRTSISTNNLGGGLGYRFYISDRQRTYWDVRGSVAASLADTDWKQTVYDIRCVWGVVRYGINLSAGFRHINTHKLGMSCVNNIYTSVGFSF